MKKKGLGIVFMAIASLFAIAGCVIYWINTHGAYYKDFNPTIILLAVLGIFAIIVLNIWSIAREEQIWMDLFYILAAVLFAYAGVSLLGDRVESAAIILGSDLEAGNKIALQSLYMSFVGVGCFIFGMIMTGVAGFFDKQKDV